MNIKYLITIYLLVFLTISIGIYGGIKIIRQERFIKYENAAPSKQALMKRNEKKFDLFFKFLFLVSILTLFVGIVIPGVRDIPNVLNKDYQIITGVALTSAGRSNVAFPKIVTIKSTSGKEERLRFYSKEDVSKGDHLKIVYLPHLKRGTVLEHHR